MTKITLGITGLLEISGRDYEIEKPYWGPCGDRRTWPLERGLIKSQCMDCPPRKCGRCREAAVSEGSTVIYISTFIRAFTCDPNGTWLAVDSL